MNKKPLNRKAYGHIPHLSKSRTTPEDHHCSEGQEKICTEQPRSYKDIIIVQEKLDGSCCAVAKVNDTLFALTRAGYKAETSPYKMHHYFDKWVNKEKTRFLEMLENGERVVGEWLIQAHGTRYKLKHEPFVPFDIMINSKRSNFETYLKRIHKFDFTPPRLISYGLPISVKDVLKRLKYSGHGAIDPTEGAVWRVEKEGQIDFLTKYVRPDKIDGVYLPEISKSDSVWNVDIELLNSW